MAPVTSILNQFSQTRYHFEAENLLFLSMYSGITDDLPMNHKIHPDQITISEFYDIILQKDVSHDVTNTSGLYDYPFNFN